MNVWILETETKVLVFNAEYKAKIYAEEILEADEKYSIYSRVVK